MFSNFFTLFHHNIVFLLSFVTFMCLDCDRCSPYERHMNKNGEGKKHVYSITKITLEREFLISYVGSGV